MKKRLAGVLSAGVLAAFAAASSPAQRGLIPPPQRASGASAPSAPADAPAVPEGWTVHTWQALSLGIPPDFKEWSESRTVCSCPQRCGREIGTRLWRGNYDIPSGTLIDIDWHPAVTGRRIRETRTIDHLPQIAVPHGQSVPLSPGPPLPVAAGPNASSFSFSHRVGEAEHEVRVHGVVVLIDHRLIGHKEDFAAGFMMLRIVHFNLDPAATAAATESLLKTLRYGAIPSAP